MGPTNRQGGKHAFVGNDVFSHTTQAGKARTIRAKTKPKPGETDDKFFVNADNNVGDQNAVGVFVNVPPFAS